LRISNFLKLENKRHPATYLLEAADDIAFSAADLEDGVKIGILDFDSIYNMFEKCLEEDPLKVQILQSLESNYLNCKDLGQSRLDFTVRNFRIFAQGIMIESVVKTFFENYDAFMSGDYPYEILDHNEGRNIRKAFKQLGRIVYLSKDVAEIELAGWKIINGLLHEFITAAESENFGTDTNSKENRIYSLISTSYRHIYKNYSNQNSDNQKYLKFQLVLDHISGMTDTYALKLYQRITGISI
jgi:dGTPase